MTETQRRIRAYKKALPELRERVIAVAVLLAMSASMVASASFAWITLSTAPEISGMATTVAANGNLEIALAYGDSMRNGQVIAAEEPSNSVAGDSSVIQGIVDSNITWGNLINLSEPEYGVSNIYLRPALLNNMNLNIAPLYGAMYGSDGRVVNTSVNYGYASWQDIGKGVWSFAAGDKTKYGVRAISTLTYDKEVGNAILEEYVTASRTAYDQTVNEYHKLVHEDHAEAHVLVGGRSCIQALEGLVTVFAQDKVNDMEVSGMELWPDNVERGTKNSCSAYIYNVYEMLLIMRDILEQEGEGLRHLANRIAYTNTKEGQTPNTNTYDCVVASQGGQNPLLKYTDAQLKAANISLATYNEFRTDYYKIEACIDSLLTKEVIVNAGGIERFKNPNDNTLPPVYYEQIANIVNELANIDTTEINGTQLRYFGGSAALDLITGGNAEVIIMAGVLPRFELRALENRLQRINEAVTVSVKTRKIALVSPKGEITVDGTVKTKSYSLGDGSYLAQFNSLGSGGFAGIGDAVAQDTYGMAIDLWVRTNYPNAVLTLEGNVLTEKVHAQDPSGNYLYTITVDEVTTDVYKKSKAETDTTYYYVENNEEVPAEEVQNPEAVYTEVIVGYEGENRVWSEEALALMAEKGFLEKDPTTQGSGSCFVFYADSQSEQAKLLEMLDSFTVAFIDESGTKLATAKLNTEKAFKNQGRVSVPMEIVDSKVTYEEKGESGETIVKNGIMQMVQNQATRITAIVYLDGTDLQNQNVLAAGELSGQMNIQFGTDTLLLPPADQELQREYRTITATAVSDDGQTWPTDDPENNAISYEHYTADGHDITVNLDVEGVQPQKISGFFVRVINDTQGARMETEEFTAVVSAAEGEDAESGNVTWTATFHLTNPGKYILSDLLVDGMQYHLENGNHPTVMIPGLTLGAVTTVPAPGSYITADTSASVTVTASVLSELGLPSNVTVHFYEKGNIANQFISGMTYDSGSQTWKGNIVFSKSGTYVLDSLTVDGQSMDILNKLELTYRLGMYCYVNNNHPDHADTFTYDNKSIQVPVTAQIYDDKNNPVEGEDGVVLNYSIGGSSINVISTGMDWNADGELAGYYSGTLTLGEPETYQFYNLVTDKGAISSAKASPTFTVNPKDPPAYKAGSAKAPETQLAISSDLPATMEATVENATNATVWAEMKSGTTTRYVKGVRSADKFTFTFNTADGVDNNDLTDGIWTLTNLYVQKFTHADGTVYPETDPNKGEDPGFKLQGVDQLQTRIITKDSLNVNAVTDETTYEGAFMDQHKPKLTVTVTDRNGNALSDVSITGGRWSVVHEEGSQELHGGYTGAYDSGKYTDEDTPQTGLQIGADGTAQFEDLRTAGMYKTTRLVVSLTADNGTANYPVTVGPTFTIKSTAPTVTIKSITPTGTYKADNTTAASLSDTYTTKSASWGRTTTNWTINSNHKSVTSSISTDKLTASVYFKCFHADGTTWSSTGYGVSGHRYHAQSDGAAGTGNPTVTLELSGISGFSSATLNFSSNTHIYEKMQVANVDTFYRTITSTNALPYSWNASGTCTRYIGYSQNTEGRVSDSVSQTGTRTAAGTITANQLTVVYSGKTFTFTIPTITINNPY